MNNSITHNGATATAGEAIDDDSEIKEEKILEGVAVIDAIIANIDSFFDSPPFALNLREKVAVDIFGNSYMSAEGKHIIMFDTAYSVLYFTSSTINFSIKNSETNNILLKQFYSDNKFKKYKTAHGTDYYINSNAEFIIDHIGNCNKYNILSHKDMQLYLVFSKKPENRQILLDLLNLIKTLEEYKIPEKSSKFYLIAHGQQGFKKILTSCKPEVIKDNRYDLYYGKTFDNSIFIKFIHEKTENLMMLHGEPGTGKTNFIKNLIKDSKRDIVYIAPGMASMISSPDFIEFMFENRKCILLIEDAEEIISKDRNAATNNILNITDGFLKDALDLKIICTFNRTINDVDDALLRKGRLYYKHEFRKLKSTEIYDLADHLDLDISDDIKEDLTLADIFKFNQKVEEKVMNEKRKIGFGS